MTEQIADPYVASYNKQTRQWNVTYRYLIAGKIKFSYIATAKNQEWAKTIARLLNMDHEVKNGW